MHPNIRVNIPVWCCIVPLPACASDLQLLPTPASACVLLQTMSY